MRLLRLSVLLVFLATPFAAWADPPPSLYLVPVEHGITKRDARKTRREVQATGTLMRSTRDFSRFGRPSGIAPGKAAYRNAGLGVSLTYPGDWSMAEDAFALQGAQRSASFVPPRAKKTAAGTEGIVLAVEQPAPETLELYVVNAVWWLKDSLDDFYPIAAGSRSLGGKPAFWMTFTGTQKGQDVKVREVWAIAGKRVIIISLWASPSTFDALSPVFDDMLLSFSFTP